MQLSYTETIADTQSIKVILDEGEQLGHFVGPAEIFVPQDPANTEYAEIVAQKLPIEPYVPIPRLGMDPN